MAAIRKPITRNPNHSSLIPPTLFICRRGIASKLFIGGLSFYIKQKGLLDAFSRYGLAMECVIFVDYAKSTARLGCGMPIVRGPPDPIAQN